MSAFYNILGWSFGGAVVGTVAGVVYGACVDDTDKCTWGSDNAKSYGCVETIKHQGYRRLLQMVPIQYGPPQVCLYNCTQQMEFDLAFTNFLQTEMTKFNFAVCMGAVAGFVVGAGIGVYRECRNRYRLFSPLRVSVNSVDDRNVSLLGAEQGGAAVLTV